jgi:membrane fusion protein (multidrug efflux system)
MAGTPTPIPSPDSGTAGELRSRTTTLGPGRPSARRSKTGRNIALISLVLVLIVVGILLYRHYAAWESTDDAQIDGYIYPVSARVGGYVTRVMVDDNQFVKAGTVLAQLDPKDYEVAVANAKAAWANGQASAAALQTNVPLTSVNTSSELSSAAADVDNFNAGLLAAERQVDAAQATLQQAEANDLKAQDDVNRYKPLAAKDEIPQQLYTQATASQAATAAAVQAAKSSAAAAEQAVTQARAKVVQAQARMLSARTRPQQISVQRSRAEAALADTQRASAVFDQAQLNLQYTTIVAPIDGVVGQRSVQPGQNVTPGQQLMTIIPLDSQNIWVTANFKETQMTKMRTGQHVEISVDTYGRKYDGHIDSIAGASGARYSLLPPENATGNYVKVVQRIPVKIFFEKGQDPEHLLRPGMSVEPDVKVE